MNDLLERALALWRDPLPPGEAALHAFRSVYADPVVVNGSPTDLQPLVDRARMLQTALSDVAFEVHDVVEAAGRLAFAFTITGRHSGTFVTPLGATPASGAAVSLTGLDIMTVDQHAGRVTAVWAVADWLTLARDIGAVA